MKIVSWNCKMAYGTKAEHVLKFRPDIVVVPECENFEEQTLKSLWFGDNKKKGLGVFSYSTFELELHKEYNPIFKYIVPIKASGQIKFNLLAIWAMNDSKDVRRRYIGQVWLALNYYKEMLDEPIIIIGDFNWDMNIKQGYPLYGTLTDVIAVLKNKNIVSAYHSFYGEEFGNETKDTLFMYHNKNKSYHVDYCFVSNHFGIQDVEIGVYSDWTKYSDHVPIIITFSDDKGFFKSRPAQG